MEKEVIIYFVGFAVCLINSTWIYGRLLDKKLNITQKFLFVFFLLSLFATLLSSFLVPTFKMIISLIFLATLIKFYYKDPLLKVIFYSIMLWGFGLLFDMLFMITFSFFYEYYHVSWNFFIPLEYLLTFPLQLFYNLISRTKIFKTSLNFLYNIFNKISMYSVFFVVACLVYVGSRAVLTLGDFNKEIIIIIIGLFAVWIIIQTISLMYLNLVNKETYKILQNNNKFYVDINTDLRTFKHNLLHKLDGVKSYSNTKSKKLIDAIIKECKLLRQANVELDKLPNGINGLIQSKLYNKYDNTIQIVVDNNIEKDIFDLIKAKNYIKLCEVLGVTLDNAIEAMKESKDKIIYISLDESDKELVVVIKNTFCSFIDIDKLGTINYTTKGNDHGLGLFSILFKNKIKTKLKIVNNMFETQIIINKLRKE